MSFPATTDSGRYVQVKPSQCSDSSTDKDSDKLELGGSNDGDAVLDEEGPENELMPSMQPLSHTERVRAWWPCLLMTLALVVLVRLTNNEFIIRRLQSVNEEQLADINRLRVELTNPTHDDYEYRYRMMARRYNNNLQFGPIPWDCLPAHTQKGFAMSGLIPGLAYKAAVEPNSGNTSPAQLATAIATTMQWERNEAGIRVPLWTPSIIQTLVDLSKAGQDISVRDYPGSVPDLQVAWRSQGGIANLRVMVAGSISPWVEAALIAAGAHSTTSPHTTTEKRQPHKQNIRIAKRANPA
jgi:hypothetical protein